MLVVVCTVLLGGCGGCGGGCGGVVVRGGGVLLRSRHWRHLCHRGFALGKQAGGGPIVTSVPTGAGGEKIAPWFASHGWCGPAVPVLRGPYTGLLEGLPDGGCGNLSPRAVGSPSPGAGSHLGGRRAAESRVWHPGAPLEVTVRRLGPMASVALRLGGSVHLNSVHATTR